MVSEGRNAWRVTAVHVGTRRHPLCDRIFSWEFPIRLEKITPRQLTQHSHTDIGSHDQLSHLPLATGRTQCSQLIPPRNPDAMSLERRLFTTADIFTRKQWSRGKIRPQLGGRPPASSMRDFYHNWSYTSHINERWSTSLHISSGICLWVTR